MEPRIIINPLASPLIHRPLQNVPRPEWNIDNRFHTLVISILDADTAEFIIEGEGNVTVASDNEHLSFVHATTARQSEPQQPLIMNADEFRGTHIILVADEGYPYGDEVTITVGLEYAYESETYSITKQASILMTKDDLLSPGTPVITVMQSLRMKYVGGPIDTGENTGSRGLMDCFVYLSGTDNMDDAEVIVQGEGKYPRVALGEFSVGETGPRLLKATIDSDSSLPIKTCFNMNGAIYDIGAIATIKASLFNKNSGQVASLHVNYGAVHIE